MEDFDNLRMAIIIPFGRSGSVFLHNLLDSHPEVMTIPIVFPFYYRWHVFHSTERQPTLEKLTNFYLEEYGLGDLVSPTSSLYEYVCEGKKLILSIDKDVFVKIINELLLIGNISYPTRKQWLSCLHVAYYRYFNLSLQGKKIIILNEHYAYQFPDILKDFPHLQCIATVRDPLDMYASSIKYCQQQYVGIAQLIFLFLGIFHHKANQQNVFLFENNQPGRVHYIKLEELNLFSQKTMEELALFLNVNFDPILLEPTQNGSLKKGISNFNVPKVERADGMQKPQWEGICSVTELRLMQAIAINMYDKFDYKKLFNKGSFFLMLCVPDPVYFRRISGFFSKMLYLMTGMFIFRRLHLCYLYSMNSFNRHIRLPGIVKLGILSYNYIKNRRN